MWCIIYSVHTTCFVLMELVIIQERCKYKNCCLFRKWGVKKYYVHGFESKSVSCLVMSYSFSNTWEKCITWRIPRMITQLEYWEYQDMQIMLKGDSVLDCNVVCWIGRKTQILSCIFVCLGMRVYK